MSSPQVLPILPTKSYPPEGFEYDNRDDSIDIVPIKKEYQDKQRQNMTDKQHVEIQADRDIEAARRFYEENPNENKEFDPYAQLSSSSIMPPLEKEYKIDPKKYSNS